MGRLYLGRDPEMDRLVAIKLLREGFDTRELRERFSREARTVSALRHPNIVTIFETGTHEGQPFIVMEYIQGETLSQIIRRGATLGLERKLQMMDELCAGLYYAHRKNVVHRDIKPANIMIHEDGTAKITDFGVAKIMSQQMTLSGTMMGTPSYMSPEQVQSIPITGRADQFSLAVIVYEALTGEKPFAAEYMPTLLYKIVREDPVPPQRLNTTLNAQVETTLRKALAKLPDDRYETCTDFIAALAAACNTSPNWTPIPRGASPQMPTAGSNAELAETVAEIRPPAAGSDETVLIPAAKTMVVPVVEIQQKPSHTLRNFLLGFVVVAAIGIGAFFATQKPAAPAPEPAAVTAPVPDPAVPASQPAPAASPDPNPVANAPATPATATAKEGSFQLTASPAGATATFDTSGVECTTPCNLTLPAGRHSFVLHQPGYRDLQKIINIPNDTGLIIDLVPMTGTLNLLTDPPGLTVLIDGREHPQKTPVSLTLPVGPHRVQVVKGTERQELQVDLSDGQFVSKTISWQ